MKVARTVRRGGIVCLAAMVSYPTLVMPFLMGGFGN